jgi:tetratricopeptide (TPR) repeat protein
MGNDSVQGDLGRVHPGSDTSDRIDASNRGTRESWRAAVELRLRGRYAEALAYCERVLQFDPDQGRLWVEYGWALLGVGRSREGLEALARALSLNPGSPDRWVKYGTALLGEGHAREGLGAFVQALSLDPCSAELWGEAGAAFHRQCLHQAALRCYLVAANLGGKHDAADARDVAKGLQRAGIMTVETDRIADEVRQALPAAPGDPGQMAELIGVLKLRDATEAVSDLHARAVRFLSGPRIISEPGATIANLIARYLAGAAWDDPEWRNLVSDCVIAAQNKAASLEGVEPGPGRDARFFYEQAAALLEEIHVEVSAGRR